ncbi:GDSL-type esterase/lipase family protein [Methylobacterium sp. E-046]|uniref:GDSL-type esterase/lipase family protein n=1 Tax=Methylobacterium sp. E-046 TaxID=2836576 RepID=UPI001FBA63CC|nr:GDSL-type esterase/lipase family protein [Methylobacterium sp. E-046]MCJ2099386.1 GDSL-type esterase/lipase family protein [Methylobacterium sp. E-046]
MSAPAHDTPLFPLGPILFFGDSVTAALTAETPALFSGPQTVARGIPGQSTRDMARRLRSDIALYGARGLHVIGGRDDILGRDRAPSFDRIATDIAAMLQDARDLHVRTWIGSIPPVDPGAPGAAGVPVALIGQVNAWLRDHVEAYGAAFIDYDAVLATETGALRPALSDDGVRLNAAGHAALRGAMLAALTAPGVEQIWAPPESEDAARRRKFLHHFGYLDSNTRFPSPFIQFAGKPGASHYGVPFDADGFLNAAPIVARKPADETRILVVGDSTTIDGGDIANTLPGRIERILRADGLASAKVYNFGVMSSCLTQMTHLIWSRLVTYSPDAIVVLSGSTDLFQPWTYDPRPGHPYNAFITERLYDHFFDTHDPRAREDGLSYEGLVSLIYEELKRLRAEVGWQSPGWEDAIVHHYQLAAHRLAKLSHDHAVPIVSVLQPTVLRKRHLTAVERGVASGAFLAYLDRQYGKLEAFTAALAARRPYRRTFTALDLSGIFRAREEGTFYDIVHYDDPAREIVAARLAGEVRGALERARARTLFARAKQLLGGG